jgi:hypothetical protein
VTDRGPGFELAFLEHAFERFTRPQRGRAGSGAGLGRSIARAIAEGHGGSAHAANSPDGDADVWRELPLDAVSQTRLRSGPEAKGLGLYACSPSYDSAVSPGRGSSTPVSGGPTGTGASGRR